MSMDDNDGQMIFGDLGGLKLPDTYIENFVYQRDVSMIIFERKIRVIAGIRTTDLQFSVLAL